ncbi:MAG: ATP-binding cassette domain-containing protein [Treponema sp.]|jgi:ABC-type bacteriocin/lantibiotic exporter with double-glycine peptidase domain|nr:ATP-binding cassette domain-containing protein [Treponema sp.]
MKLSNIKTIFRANIDAVLYVFILNILLFIPSLLTPIYRKIFTDYILIDYDTSWLYILLTMMFMTAFFAGAVNWFQRNCLFRLSNKIETSNLNKYMWIMFNSPLKLFFKRDSYTLISQSEKSSRISSLFTKDILSLFFDLFRVVFYLFLMMRIDTSMSLIVVALVVANIGFGKINSLLQDAFSAKKEKKTTAAPAAQGERIYAQGLQSIETFKSTCAEQVLFKRMLNEKTAEINSKRKNDFANACSPIDDLPEIIFLNILLLISALRIMDRSFSIGTYLEFQAYASAFFYPLSGVLAVRSKLLSFEKSLRAFFKELTSNDEEASSKLMRINSRHKLDGNIEFKNVSFGYKENAPVISNFYLSVKPGQRIAIIGKSGTGKTTLLKLLQGLYEPDAGEITIDGIPVTKLGREYFKNSIGCANQEISLFSGSIRDNITMWDESLTETGLYQAASDACIHQYISSLDGAYEHQLTENGSNISKGQCQKIEIARALIYHPSIILFDETTSSVDPESREHIQNILQKRGCAILMVTHLLSQIIDYDEIIVLGKNEVIARGKHDDLLNSSLLYKTLYEAERISA